MRVTIFHNPSCSNSRNTLALIRASGAEPEIVEYLKTPPTLEQLIALITAMGTGARSVLRDKEPLCAELGLDDPARSDSDVVEAMLAHPILINRPIVVTEKGVRLCRPPELVLDLLEQPAVVEE